MWRNRRLAYSASVPGRHPGGGAAARPRAYSEREASFRGGRLNRIVTRRVKKPEMGRTPGGTHPPPANASAVRAVVHQFLGAVSQRPDARTNRFRYHAPALRSPFLNTISPSTVCPCRARDFLALRPRKCAPRRPREEETSGLFERLWPFARRTPRRRIRSRQRSKQIASSPSVRSSCHLQSNSTRRFFSCASGVPEGSMGCSPPKPSTLILSLEIPRASRNRATA